VRSAPHVRAISCPPRARPPGRPGPRRPLGPVMRQRIVTARIARPGGGHAAGGARRRGRWADLPGTPPASANGEMGVFPGPAGNCPRGGNGNPAQTRDPNRNRPDKIQQLRQPGPAGMPHEPLSSSRSHRARPNGRHALCHTLGPTMAVGRGTPWSAVWLRDRERVSRARRTVRQPAAFGYEEQVLRRRR
jgi:hypothetical protein